MTPRVSRWQTLGASLSKFGWGATLHYALHRLVNRFFLLERLHIIVLDRDKLRAVRPKEAVRLSWRLASIEDLQEMRKDAKWDIGEDKIGLFRAGDKCILSFVDDRLAGYTWTHTAGRPTLLPGLTISVPAQYLYNFAALTLPDFRGHGLQPYRHHAALTSGLWGDRRGLLGFVRATNYASRHGLVKSGYRRIGTIWRFGSRRAFRVYCSPSLGRIGVRRI